jgi:hypothetical protein
VHPANATYVSATLKLYGNPTSNHTQLNSSYPSAPFGTTNESWLRRINAPWNLYTLNWTNQPSVDTTNQVLLPVSSAQIQAYVVDVSKMVKTMLDTPSKNYGFMFMLQNELKFRTLVFGSSHNPDSNVRPILEIVYNTPIPSSVPALNANAEEINIYPNPVSHTLHITFTNTHTEPVDVNLINATGQTVIHINQFISSNGSVDLKLEEMPRGMYFLKIKEHTKSVFCKTVLVQ